jgi:hypothetical protein
LARPLPPSAWPTRFLLTPPPFDSPDSLSSSAKCPTADPISAPRPVSYARLDEWRQRAGTLASIEGYDGTNATLTGLGDAERVSVTEVTPGLLQTLGVSAWLGRRFDTGDIGEHRAIVSHAFWSSRLGRDPHAVGRSITLNSEVHTIVGVLPERFAFALDPSDIWRPMPRLAPGDPRISYRMHGVAGWRRQ